MDFRGLPGAEIGSIPTDYVDYVLGAGTSPGSGPLPFLAQLRDSFWLPVQGSSAAAEVDLVFYVIYAISAVFFALIVGVMIAFAWRYRRRRGHRTEPSPHHSFKLEVAWTVVPVILSAMIFWIGFKTFMNLATPPANAYEVNVTAQKWQWFFTYPNGHVSDELHVPVDRPVRLTMTSEDVIHSFWVPAFRVKKDVVPGRYTQTWFHAKVPGRYPVLCTEYCGTGHSDMLSTVVVHEAGGFERWLREESDVLGTLPPAEAGERLASTKGCLQCHSVDGSPGIGPSFQDLFGAEVPLQGGGTVVADENYVRESIIEPLAKIHAGYEPVMPTYAGKVKDQEITMLIAYFKTISRFAAAEDPSQDSAAAGAAVEGAAGGDVETAAGATVEGAAAGAAGEGDQEAAGRAADPRVVPVTGGGQEENR
ncbi:MAG: cytochrome c oxidase subunit II [Candidatus Krumholzibacteriia bacterium]